MSVNVHLDLREPSFNQSQLAVLEKLEVKPLAEFLQGVSARGLTITDFANNQAFMKDSAVHIGSGISMSDDELVKHILEKSLILKNFDE